jgi:hypothetical protein
LAEFPEGLLFRMDGEDVLVHAGMAEKTVRVRYGTLLTAWRSFAECVRAALVSETPELRTHPYWQRLAEDPDRASTADWWEYNWRVYVAGHEDCFDHVDAVER